MKLLTMLFNMLRGHDEETMLDHVPIGGNVAASKLKRARKKAAERHGKPFHCDKIKPRETEPSQALKSLAAETVIVLPANVSSLLRVGNGK